ncbi:GNAT family N-acetyltransferase [Janthinobacterium agaricidamnosum]|uniref:Acetyltransferase family protein n=1 Tax=Janthinobacterium agaricidamnosum NBRC 102515 = DSM 9628 TaxID=1349767 RepID=W0UWW8_9BURK|nr:GNAT family N-acetyltransferase [Janthinobacterium agaricidamnosum]CDG80944.1 acetyltransferase family protein [Janthinobacterium agaricidamnosum NBRC 102515 = DSM 9628]
MTITVRIATGHDIDTVFEIRTSVRQNHLSREQLAEMGITPEALLDAIDGGDARIWIAEMDGAAAAFAMADADEGTVFAMFVRPQYEGRGLGRLLMQEAEAFLFARKELIWLVTDAASEIRANGFYQRLGWRQAGAIVDGDIRYEKTAGK